VYTAGHNSKSVINVITDEFRKNNIIWSTNNNIIPNDIDKSTLFICSGMQPLKHLFNNPNKTQLGTFQKCIRTNDIDLVGDGSHLTSFTMVGSFGFGTNNYEQHCEMWSNIINNLGINIDYVTCNPMSNHQNIWVKLGFKTKFDSECIWKSCETDNGDYCCEMFSNKLEIGNLVNPNKHSIDVGFGFERLIQLIGGCSRVDESSLFDQNLSPISRDHLRTIRLLISQNIFPGGKGKQYICRKLIRRFIKDEKDFKMFSFKELMEAEVILMNKKLSDGHKVWKKFKDRGPEFWWETFGILPEEIKLLE